MYDWNSTIDKLGRLSNDVLYGRLPNQDEKPIRCRRWILLNEKRRCPFDPDLDPDCRFKTLMFEGELRNSFGFTLIRDSVKAHELIREINYNIGRGNLSDVGLKLSRISDILSRALVDAGCNPWDHFGWNPSLDESVLAGRPVEQLLYDLLKLAHEAGDNLLRAEKLLDLPSDP